MDREAWCAVIHGVAESWTRLSDFTFTFHFHALEKEMATHSSVLAWRIPGMGEPGGLPFMGSQRVGHDLATDLIYIYIYIASFNFMAAITICSDFGAQKNSQQLFPSLKLTSIDLVMPSSHLILCRPLLLLPPIPSSTQGVELVML